MKLHIGNLPFQFTDQDLRQLLVAFDHIKSATVVTDKISGRSKGFGFVEFTNKSEALAAIAYLNGRTREGRTMQVSIAQESAPGAPNRQDPAGAASAKSGRGGKTPGGKDSLGKNTPGPAARKPARKARVPKAGGGKGLVAKVPASQGRRLDRTLTKAGTPARSGKPSGGPGGRPRKDG